MQKIRTLYNPFFRDGVIHQSEKATSSIWFDAVMAALSLWLVGGAYLDGWAHIHIFHTDTFFTPTHAVLYSGYLACAVFLFGAFLRKWLQGYPSDRALPSGYRLSLIGAVAFGLGGVMDFIWHSLFGIEANIDALLSPAHLILGISAALIVTGPLRAAWLRFKPERDQLLPALISLTLFYSMITFFTEFISPFEETIMGVNRMPPNPALAPRFQALGVADFLLQSSILVGIILFFLRRWRFPFGGLTLLVGFNTMAMSLMHAGWFSTGTAVMIGVGFAAGLTLDLLHARLKPSLERPAAFRWFAFLIPTSLYSLYYLALFIFGGGVWWSVHLWVGSIFMSGIAGYLLSFAFLPPALPKEAV